VAKKNPRFAVLGGDLAYTHGFKYLFRGRKWQVSRWQSFLKEWNEIMRTPDGHLIPMIPVIGNHDVRPSNLNPFSDNMLFYEIFFLPGNRSYRTLDVGSYLSFFLLDTGHSFHMEGAQTTWLAETLVAREHKPYKLGVYHVGAYPSVYSFQSGNAAAVRKLWSPLFEKYGVQMTFEHHNHSYKRTYPLIQGKQIPTGVIYMGDGSWGVAPRKPKNKALPYFAKTKKVNAVSIVTLAQEKGTVRVISASGKLVDTAEITPSSDLVSFDERRVTRH
jgi:3',5'-cyclic AMP phosphodiesterase CpdA